MRLCNISETWQSVVHSRVENETMIDYYSSVLLTCELAPAYPCPVQPPAHPSVLQMGAYCTDQTPGGRPATRSGPSTIDCGFGHSVFRLHRIGTHNICLHGLLGLRSEARRRLKVSLFRLLQALTCQPHQLEEPLICHACLETQRKHASSLLITYARPCCPGDVPQIWSS